jgi:RNA polymerase sigma-70 factor (ECF subfamily)
MDRELVERAQGGDLEAFDALTASTHPRLYRVALGILRDTDQAEDATQAALVEVWKYLPRLRDPQAFESWSYRLLVRSCMREARDTRRWLPEIPSGHDEPRAADTFGAVVDRDQLERGFRRLSVEHRAVIVMRYLLDLSHEDTAAALDISPGTVGSRLSRAMAALRAALEADDRPTETLREATEAER